MRSSPEARSGSAAQIGVVSAIMASSAVKLAGAEARTDANRRLVMRAMADSIALICSRDVHCHAANVSTAALRAGTTGRRPFGKLRVALSNVEGRHDDTTFSPCAFGATTKPIRLSSLLPPREARRRQRLQSVEEAH